MMKFFFVPSLVVVGLLSYGLYSYRQQQSDEAISSDNSSNSDKIPRESLMVSAGGNTAAQQSTATGRNMQGSKSKYNLSGDSRLDSSADATPKQLEEARKRYSQIVNNTQYPTLEARITALEALYPQQSFRPNELVDLLAEPNAWHPTSLSNQANQELPLTPEQRNDGRKFIELKPERLLVTLPGDSLELPIEQLGGNLQMTVDSREALPNGGFVLHGRLTNTDEVMRVTLTQTPGLSLAGIETPKGHYVLQANDGQGWIASSDTLFKQDERQHDMVIPPGS